MRREVSESILERNIPDSTKIGVVMQDVDEQILGPRFMMTSSPR
jgi:hypothetical protein